MLLRKTPFVAACLLASVVAQAAGAQTTSAPKTQAAAAKATGKPTTDAPAATQTQGTAWAVKQAAQPSATPAATAAPVAAPAAPATNIAKVTPQGDLIDTLKASGQFTTLLKGLDATNLTAVLRRNQGLTLFAPTDSAFRALPPAELAQLTSSATAMQKLLTHHLINANIESSKIKGAMGPAPSVGGDQIVLDGTGAALKADNATIVQADIATSNGTLHVVDAVLKAGSVPAAPPAAAEAAPQPAQTTTAAKR